MNDNSLLVLIGAIKRSLVVLVAIFIGCWIKYPDILRLIEQPLLNIIGVDRVVSLSLLNAFSVPLQLCWDICLLLFIPYFLFELWRFVMPALTKKEQQFIWPIFIASCVLFVLGSVFAYKIIFPVMFDFLVKLMPSDIKLMPDIVLYIKLCSDLILTFGLAAQLPLAMAVLSLLGVVSIDYWIKIRPHAIVCFFVVGMLLTPPDVLSQILLAVPLCLLYEFGIIIVKIVHRHRLKNK